ncbi:hypothetical protein AAZX31_15G236400 [Glycine max]|uniref:Glutathione S-transferase n=2 Tax=Glycine subgen. Soja TaxID=1462606 RepID=K7MDV5_SOYBN|nr:hypothetical protein GYH30_043420 [Glycine max]KRH13627.1 hypothetical protein GLYMA_15G252500v4 [Glycine max]RZB66189.1 Glutathione S-transferase U20 [Glycine soja]|eukprot:XP_014623277.1 probable glutathione S-transferase parC [Glycine max]
MVDPYLSPSSFLSTCIDEVWKQEKQLFSDDPHYRARARFWIDLFDKKIADYGMRLWASKGEDQEAAKKEFLECMKLLENELRDKPYFASDCFGLLDIDFTTKK